MSAEGLGQALRSLCNRTGWCYAVFWKLKRRSRMVLTWEDSYYEFATLPPIANALSRSGAGNGRSPLDMLLLKQDGGIAEDQIQLAVAKMSFQVYSLGEGIIGRVAFSGKHQWVFAAGERSMESGVPAALEHGWSNQFEAGIKTIAVIAVQQQGVVQLGSTQTMAEDLNLVGQIRALFGALQSMPGAFVPEFTPDGQAGRGLSVVPKAMPTYVNKPASTLAAFGSSARTTMSSRPACPVSTEGEHMLRSAAKVVEPAFQLSTSSWASMVVPSMGQKPQDIRPASTGLYSSRSQVFQEDPGHLSRLISKAPVESFFNSSETGRLSNFSSELSYGQSIRHFDSSGWPPPDSTLPVSTRDYDQNLPLPTSFGDETGMMRPGPEEGFDYNSLFKAFQKDDLDDFNNLLASLNKEYAGGQASGSTTCSQFAFGDELSEVVVSHSKCGPSKEELYVNMPTQPVEDMKPAKLALPFDGATAAMDKTRDAFVNLSADRPEQLLDAVVAGASTSSLGSRGPTSAKSSLGCAPALTVGNAVQYLEKQLSSSSSLDRDIAANWPASSVSVDVSSSSWTEGSQAKKSEEHSYKDTSGAAARKQEEPSRMAGRKRLRPGEAPRPRPKDRQQIQDRVRELRDIVPNATKQCSIDALLEKTIRHMKFLQSVTQHGDKWKAGGDVKGERSAENSSGLENGASWAMELDAKGSGVPILVENLKQPRQMLVEMLCEERGLFWEIADNIRGLGLTILKGVMESRNDKIWARFNVEVHAAKEVNRLKVVWNLTQLLRPSGKNTSAPSFVGSEMSDVCSESFGSRFQPQVVASHGITVSPGSAW
ncbi:transcription factor EMB1444 isoform X1 [Selaginella moellendorffii]|uniref:transcription factor EMB1444 isoform X1 n=1 Tax=Selaginella moellendorffii TaxID=88036 RepID=UPI000D1C6EDB|nr:transcription factor EMB1444 isoform X1 [Selaginella moellendorffii]|eukprot:XP_024518233.1 transcription factor EMB1444 isoform X1 [Selaginella moellendorffii]